MQGAEADKMRRSETRAPTRAGSVPDAAATSHSGGWKGEEAAAVMFLLGVVWGLTSISPKRRGAGEGSQGIKGRKGERGQELGRTRRKSVGRDEGRGRQPAEGGSLRNIYFPAFLGWWTLHPVSFPAAPPVMSEVLSMTYKMCFNS